MGLLDDLARQGANVAHGIGRRDAQVALPPPAEVYASELLDSRTCDPCGAVDGRTYESLDAGLEDYPGAGGYIGCDGGSRCRGTLVLVHGPEATPTRDTPGDGTPAPHPPDRTPRGPTGVPRPAHIDPAGNLIPRAPTADAPALPGLDPLVTPDTGALDLTPDGATIPAPAETLDPPVTSVDPAAVARDPELAQASNDELDAIMADDTVALERRMAAADEFDQREAGVLERVWVEEELDAATLARYDAEREAWEKAGGYAADALAGTVRAGGRRIDRVRQVWTEEAELIAIRAEEATRGTLLRADRYAEFVAKYGTDTTALFEGPARVAYYYASRELRDFWEEVGGRLTFDEFAVAQGITDAKTTARAARAASARADAIARAEENAERKARRKAENARRRRTLTPGERLARDQARLARIRAATGEAGGRTLAP